jgi:IclR family transcriptional regulator, KDG regulon repressor
VAKKLRDEYSLSVLKALAVLEQFHGEIEELSCLELSRRTGLSKNNVFRLLATLESRSYLEQNRLNQHYRLGIKTYELGCVCLRHINLMEKSRPVMELLAAECPETICLAVGTGAEISYLDLMPSQFPVSVLPDLMRPYPAYTTAGGKVLLAGRGVSRASSCLSSESLSPYTSNTMTEVNVLLSQLREVRETGYAVDNEETELGARSVAAPIYDHNDKVVAALCVLGPVTRLTDERIKDELAPLVVRCAHIVSRGLGQPTAQVVAQVVATSPQKVKTKSRTSRTPVAGKTATENGYRRGRSGKTASLPGLPIPAASLIPN